MATFNETLPSEVHLRERHIRCSTRAIILMLRTYPGFVVLHQLKLVESLALGLAISDDDVAVAIMEILFAALGADYPTLGSAFKDTLDSKTDSDNPRRRNIRLLILRQISRNSL